MSNQTTTKQKAISEKKNSKQMCATSIHKNCVVLEEIVVERPTLFETCVSNSVTLLSWNVIKIVYATDQFAFVSYK